MLPHMTTPPQLAAELPHPPTHLAHKLLWVVLPQLSILVIKAQRRQHHLQAGRCVSAGAGVKRTHCLAWVD